MVDPHLASLAQAQLTFNVVPEANTVLGNQIAVGGEGLTFSGDAWAARLAEVHRLTNGEHPRCGAKQPLTHLIANVRFGGRYRRKTR